MKVALLAATSVFLSATALGAEGPLARKLSFSWKKAPIKQVLKDIGAKTGLRFVHSETRIAKASPVDLDVKNQPASHTLRTVLRPRGLQVVLSKQGLAALVDANGDIGCAVSFGRALRTFVRLEKKLEGAKQVRDEIFVPGWTDEDDRALAEALIDVCNAVVHFDMDRRKGPEDFRLAERMATSYDPDLRAGTVCLLMDNLCRKDGNPRAAGLLRKMLADADPLVRSCAILASLELWRKNPQVLKPIVEKAAKSPHSVERFAAAMIHVFQLERGRPLNSGAGVFVKDKSAAVRAMGYVAETLATMRKTVAMTGKAVPAGKRVPEDVAMLRDENPIVRSMGLGMVAMLSLQARDRSAMQAAAGFIKASGDPWLNICLALITSAVQNRGTESFACAKDLMLSKKKSHQLLGCAGMGALMMMWKPVRRGPGAEAPTRPKAGNLRTLLASGNLWVRSAALFVCNALEGEKTAPRVLAALRGDELDRHAVLICCLVPGTKLTPQFREALLRPSRMPSAAESTMVSEIVAGKLTGKQVVDVLIAEIRRDKASPLISALMRTTHQHRDLRSIDNPELARAVDAVLAADSAELEGELVRIWGRYGWHRKSALVLKLIERGRPETVIDVLLGGNGSFGGRPKYQEAIVETAHRRIQTLLDADSPVHRRGATLALRSVLSSDPFMTVCQRKESLRRESDDLVRKALEVALRAESGAFLPGVLLLSSALRAHTDRCGVMPGKKFPLSEHLRRACIRVLALVNHPKKGPAALGLLRQLVDYHEFRGHSQYGCHVRTRDRGSSVFTVRIGPAHRKPLGRHARVAYFGPDLVRAVDEARRKVLAAGSLEDRVALHTTLADLGERDSVAALARLVMSGKLAAESSRKALGAIGARPGLQAPEFVAWMLGKIKDRDFDVNLLDSAARHPQHLSEVLGTVKALLNDKNQAGLVHGAMHCFRVMATRYNRRNAAGPRKPRPAWLGQLARFGAEVAMNRDLSLAMRDGGAALAAESSGPAQAELLQNLVTNADLENRIRLTAAGGLHRAVPESRLYEKSLPGYSELPVWLRVALACAAGQSPKAPKAEEFVLRALTDEKIPLRGGTSVQDVILLRLELPASPRLVKAVEALRARGAFYAKNALLRMKGRKRTRQVKPPEPKTPEVF